MSIRCIAWALEQRVGDQAAKLVLLALADEASDPGIARCGRRRVAWKSELSVSTVKRALAYLVAQGFLRVHNRGRRPDGLHLTNVYQLAVTAPPGMEVQRLEPGLAPDEAGPASHVGGGANLTLPFQVVGGGSNKTRGRVIAVDPGGVTAVDHIPSCPNGLRQEGAPTADAAARERLEGIKTALLAACGLNPDRMTRSAKRALGLAAKEILEAGGEASEIPAAVRRWPEKFAGATITPKGISNQWAVLHSRPVRLVAQRDERALAESEARGRAESTLLLLGSPADLKRAEGESWSEFAARCDAAFRARAEARRAG